MAITRSGNYSQIKGSTIKIPCLVATTGDVNLTPGESPTTVDDVTLSVGDRVLVKSQSTETQNGIYITSGTTWIRAIDMSISEDVFRGIQIYINSGTVNTGKLFKLNTSDPITLGGTNLTFEEIVLGGGSAFGSDGFIQFNSGGTFSGSTNLIWNNASSRLGINTTVPNYALDVKGSSQYSAISSDMGFNINVVADPIYAPTGVVSAGGSVDTGNHYYSVTYVTAIGQTHSIVSGIITTTAGNNTVTLTIPVSPDLRVTQRKIYRTKAGGGNYDDYLLATVTNNTETTYVDTAADSTLVASTGAFFRLNTTSNNISTSGIKSFTLDEKGTYVGYLAGNAITTGGRNVFIGQYAGDGATTSSDVVAIGHQAGSGVITAGNHVFVGSYAGQAVTSAQHNTFIGYSSGFATTSSGLNVGLGYDTLGKITTGSHGNTALGYRSGTYIGTGTTTSLTNVTYSVYIGHSANSSANNQTNEIAIGNLVTGNGSNTVTIGNSSITSNFFQGVLNLPLKTISTSGTTGTIGSACWDDNYIYICTATNTWKRANLSSW